MKVYTFYYSKAKYLDPNKYCFVQVSVSKPDWFKHDTTLLESVCPNWDIVNMYKEGLLSQDDYRVIYNEQLSKLDKSALLSQLEELCDKSGKDNIVLLCWEKSQDFCHRHLLIEWLIGTTNELCLLFGGR